MERSSVGRVRSRPRRDRRPEPRRPDRRARAAQPRGVGAPRAAWRLAASPNRRGRRGPADLQRRRRSSMDSAQRRSAGRPKCVHAELVRNEARRRRPTARPDRSSGPCAPRCLLGGGPVLLESSSDDGWQEWSEVPDFADSGPDDRHFVFDPVHGEVTLGPAMRQAGRHLRPVRLGSRRRAPTCGCDRTPSAAVRSATSPATRSRVLRTDDPVHLERRQPLARPGWCRGRDARGGERPAVRSCSGRGAERSRPRTTSC